MRHPHSGLAWNPPSDRSQFWRRESERKVGDTVEGCLCKASCCTAEWAPKVLFCGRGYKTEKRVFGAAFSLWRCSMPQRTLIIEETNVGLLTTKCYQIQAFNCKHHRISCSCSAASNPDSLSGRRGAYSGPQSSTQLLGFVLCQQHGWLHPQPRDLGNLT